MPPSSAPPSKDPSAARPYIGGQAVLEGVMMRAPRAFSVVVRRRNGALHVRERPMVSPSRLVRYPLVRGVASLVESLRLGSEAIRFSAEQLERDLDGPPGKSSGLSVLSAAGLALFVAATREPGTEVSVSSGGRQGGTLTLTLVVVLAVFLFLPQGAADVANNLLGLGLGVQSPAFQAMTGGFKLLIVVGYFLLLRRVPDIRRVFQYHGAEHKTISTYEAGEPLMVETVRPKPTFHPRCGTTFVVMVVLVSILVFVAVGTLLPRIHTGSRVLDNLVFFAVKLPFLIPIAALTFELQRFFARHCSRGPLRFLLWPGSLVQRITTIEPDDAQLEVAIAALASTLRHPGAASSPKETLFPSFQAFTGGAAFEPVPVSGASPEG